jgi:hypothetical protein
MAIMAIVKVSEQHYNTVKKKKYYRQRITIVKELIEQLEWKKDDKVCEVIHFDSLGKPYLIIKKVYP